MIFDDLSIKYLLTTTSRIGIRVNVDKGLIDQEKLFASDFNVAF